MPRVFLLHSTMAAEARSAAAAVVAVEEATKASCRETDGDMTL